MFLFAGKTKVFFAFVAGSVELSTAWAQPKWASGFDPPRCA